MTTATIQGKTHIIYNNRRIVVSPSAPRRVMARCPDTLHRLLGGMGHNHSLKQGQGMVLSRSANVPSLTRSTMTVVQAQGKRKARHLRRGTSTLGFFPLSPICKPPALPWPIKGRAGLPTKGDQFDRHNTSRIQPSSDQALGVLSIIPLETWDLSLSRPFVPPTTNLFQH